MVIMVYQELDGPKIKIFNPMYIFNISYVLSLFTIDLYLIKKYL